MALASSATDADTRTTLRGDKEDIVRSLEAWRQMAPSVSTNLNKAAKASCESGSGCCSRAHNSHDHILRSWVASSNLVWS